MPKSARATTEAPSTPRATESPSTQPQSETQSEIRPRLVVELSRVSQTKLGGLVQLEELNKTTLVNRAIQVYALLRDVERSGGALYIKDSAEEPLERLRIL